MFDRMPKIVGVT